ncbi:Palmitoyltransferase akr1, ankyrin repeat-containing protein akr1 [Aureobasidium subglaciale]|nr:Palmitoyltransferase akr1, ankyrin repeat-containing protein akr1 [Aureobasidium subglaciale]
MLMDPGYIPRSASRGQQKATIEELIDAKAFDEQHFCTVFYLALLPTPPDSAIHCEVLKPEFCAQWSKDPFTLLVNGWGGIQLTWTIMLLFVQLTQIARAMTTWEAMRNNHAGPLVTALTTGSTSAEGGSIGSSGGGPTTGSTRPSPSSPESCFSQWKRLLGVDTFVATALHGSHAQEVLAQRRENPFTKGIVRNCKDFWFDGEGEGVKVVFGGKEAGMGLLGGVKVDYRKLFDLPKAVEEV